MRNDHPYSFEIMFINVGWYNLFVDELNFAKTKKDCPIKKVANGKAYHSPFILDKSLSTLRLLFLALSHFNQKLKSKVLYW